MAFEQVASKHGLSISKQQLLSDRIIGFDEASNKLLFLQLNGKKQTEYLVDLVEVESFSVNTTYSPFWNGHEKMGVYSLLLSQKTTAVATQLR